MSKNIVIFSDGTGQEGGKGHNSNVYKLFNMLENRTSRQVAFYDRGLGSRWRRKISGNVGGGGMSHNIRECYRFIFDHFEADDQIFLFGFSRGAATVRSLSSFIHYFGILPKSRPELIKQAYKIYKKHKHDADDSARRHHTLPKADDFLGRHHTIWTRIKFIGCFDTVAALGLPSKTASAILNKIPGFRHEFHDFFLSESIENAYHAIAIDEERKTFLPVLWDAKVETYQRLRQVWFSGMHTDVGGGYEEQELSDIPLVWMTQMAVEHGLLIYNKYDVPIKERADGTLHDSLDTRFAKMIYPKKIRSWDSGRPDPPVVHQSVLDGLDDHKERRKKDKPWILDLQYEVEPWVQYEDQKWCAQPKAQQANDPT